MGGCLDKPKPKGKKQKVSPELTKPTESSRTPANRQSLQQDLVEIPEQQGPKYRKMTIAELLAIYQIESTLQLSSKLEGPKYLSGLTDGSSKVLRVIVPEEISQKRLQVYKKLIGFESYLSEQGSIIILDEYCAGLDLYELLLQGKKQVLASAFKQIIATIASFHQNRTWLGNLNLSSFRQRSVWGNQVRLVDFNFVGHVAENERMGYAHKDSYEADYQFLGYLLQFILADQPPIFIQHKLQYVHFEGLSMSNTIQKLLKGVAPSKQELNLLNSQQIVSSSRVLWGYRFRRDINKLLKMRRKRKGHNRVLYGSEVQASMGEGKFNEETAYRLQTDRIFMRIQEYILEIRSIHEDSFLNYGGGGQQLRRLKEVFLLTDKDKKMSELKQCLSTIK